MNPIRPSSHSVQPLLTNHGEVAPNLPPIHAAVLSGDSARVAQLRNEGARISELDHEKGHPWMCSTQCEISMNAVGLACAWPSCSP